MTRTALDGGAGHDGYEYDVRDIALTPEEIARVPSAGPLFCVICAARHGNGEPDAPEQYVRARFWLVQPMRDGGDDTMFACCPRHAAAAEASIRERPGTTQRVISMTT